jgi:hypothetical protein
VKRKNISLSLEKVQVNVGLIIFDLAGKDYLQSNLPGGKISEDVEIRLFDKIEAEEHLPGKYKRPILMR